MNQQTIPTIDLGTYKQKDFPSVEKMAEKIELDATKAIANDSVFSHGDLLRMLYFVFDTFTPFSIRFFPIRQTGWSVLKNKDLTGDTIYIGIKETDWNADTRFYVEHNFFNEHTQKLSDLPGEVIYKKDDIRIVIKVFKNNPNITDYALIPYESEYWYMPQRFAEFCEKYDI